MNGVTFDAEGLTAAWARSVPGLIGRDAPILGLHLSDDIRSPQRGVVASLRVGASSVDIEGLGHSAPIVFEFRANGGERGARAQAYRGAAALVTAARALTGPPVVVTSGPETARLSHAHTVVGPTWMGTPSGEATYRAEATFVWQSL